MRKHCFGFYTIADYEREQKWLNDMSRGGWNMVNTCGIIYTFEKGTPGEYIYKLDLPDESMTEGEVELYYKFLEECGIEVVCRYKSWRYLRKKASQGAFETRDNTFAQLVMVNKAYGLSMRIINTFLVIFSILIIITGAATALSYGPFAQFMEGFITGISSSAIIAITLIFVPITRRLRMRMNQLIEEIRIKY